MVIFYLLQCIHIHICTSYFSPLGGNTKSFVVINCCSQKVNKNSPEHIDKDKHYKKYKKYIIKTINTTDSDSVLHHIALNVEVDFIIKNVFTGLITDILNAISIRQNLMKLNINKAKRVVL